MHDHSGATHASRSATGPPNDPTPQRPTGGGGRGRQGGHSEAAAVPTSVPPDPPYTPRPPVTRDQLRRWVDRSHTVLLGMRADKTEPDDVAEFVDWLYWVYTEASEL